MPMCSAEVPAAPSAPSIRVRAQAATFGRIARTIAGACLGGDALKRLGADDEADIEQDRQDRDQRNDREQQSRQPQEPDHTDNDTGRERIADPAADRLPSGMADIDGRRERAAEQCPDDRTDAVRQQNLAQAVVVAGGSRALYMFIPSVKL
jgi:hypothetical protein